MGGAWPSQLVKGLQVDSRLEMNDFSFKLQWVIHMQWRKNNQRMKKKWLAYSLSEIIHVIVIVKKQQEIQPVITTGGSESTEIMIDSSNTSIQSQPIQGEHVEYTI